METISESEEGFTSASQSGQVQTILSLEELITEIDRETEDVSICPKINKEISPESNKAPVPLQDQFIQFTLEKTQFALPLSSALEIGRRPDITSLPNLPAWVLGISNIRGEIISFINLKAFLGIPSTGTAVDRRFLIIHNQEMKVGIIVDRVVGILSLAQIDTDLRKSPYHQGEIANYVSGVAVTEKDLTNILSVDKLLSSRKMTSFK